MPRFPTTQPASTGRYSSSCSLSCSPLPRPPWQRAGTPPVHAPSNRRLPNNGPAARSNPRHGLRHSKGAVTPGKQLRSVLANEPVTDEHYEFNVVKPDPYITEMSYATAVEIDGEITTPGV